MIRSPLFKAGFRAMVPIIAGAFPFALVVGSVCANVGLTFFETMAMNLLVYAGAAQLAATELMSKHAASVVVIATGLTINMRFLLYSAALAPDLRECGWRTKFLSAFVTTDQAYAATLGNAHLLKTGLDRIQFYGGASACMYLFWQLGVLLGHVFGNVAPPELALDFAIPLSFVALVVPTIRDRRYLAVAVFSAIVSVFLSVLPYRLGLMATAVLAILFAAWLTRRKAAA